MGFPLSLFYRILRIPLYSSRKFRTQKKDVRIITDILS